MTAQALVNHPVIEKPLVVRPGSAIFLTQSRPCQKLRIQRQRMATSETGERGGAVY